MELGIPYRDLRVLDPMVRPVLRLCRVSGRSGKRYCQAFRPRQHSPSHSSGYIAQLTLVELKQDAVLQVASSYPTAILIRERALVINLESVRMIVCQDQVLLQNVPAPQWGPAGVFPTPDSPFVQDLKTRLSHAGSGVGR